MKLHSQFEDININFNHLVFYIEINNLILDQ
jgi:hypothetical protein